MIKTRFLLLALFFALVQFAWSQTISVSGTVSDENGIPLPGVNVIEQGSSNGVSTDMDGNYQISVPLNATLGFSYVGFIAQEIPVSEGGVINVTLRQDLQDLEEIVVVGYGVQKKTLVTGAGVSLNGEDIAALNTGSAMEALQGITPGVSITRNNGQPGAGTRVTIRGLGTIGNSNPLYIVDGIAVGNIDYLNPSDIASVDVLKDAASSAIYGSRAANGVVLITTVKGRRNSAAKITYDTYYGVQKIYKKLDPLNAQEYMYIMDEGRLNDGLEPNNWQQMITNNTWLDTNYPTLGTQYGEEIWQKLQNGWEGTNWVDEIETRNATVQNHAINITGGSEDIVYSAGVSYFEQRGILGGDIVDAGYKRLTARLNTEMILKRNSRNEAVVTIGENITYTNSQTRNTASGNIYWNDLHNALIQNPLSPAYWQPSIDNNINEFGYAPVLDGVSRTQVNPVAVMHYRNKYNYGKGNSIIGNVFAEIQFFKGLKFKSVYGINSWFGHSRSMNPTYNLGVQYVDSAEGASQGQYLGADQTFTNTLSYDHEFGNHQLNVLVGTELLKNQLNTSINGSRLNLLFPGNPKYAYLDNTNPVSSINDISVTGRNHAAGGGGLLSYFARAQYNYNEKYLFNATIRADGSSNFAKDNRWGYFPSVSAGWVLSQEDFLNTSSILDFAKIRASWGQNGNQSIPNFIYSSNITYAFPGYFFGDTKPASTSTAYPERVPNPDVKWETSEQLDIGFDARFFASRLNVTFDWYQKKTLDWLVEAPALGTSGAEPPYINGGDIENTGVELILSWDDSIGDNFKYGFTFSGAQNKNEVTRIANSDGVIQGLPDILSQGTEAVSRVEVGKPIGFFYGYETAGILQNQDEVDAYVGPTGDPYFNDLRPGDVRFVDQNNDGVIDVEDKLMLGDPNPDFELGLQLRFEYKGFYLNSTLTGKFGMQVMQSFRSFANNPTENYTSQIFNRWHGEGTSNHLPRLSSTPNRNTQFISDIYMQDADYVRINNLTLGYDFSKAIESIGFINNLKMYVSVNNLHTFTDYTGMDPEVRFSGNDDINDDENTAWASGIDLGLYPLPRTFMFGMNLGF